MAHGKWGDYNMVKNKALILLMTVLLSSCGVVDNSTPSAPPIPGGGGDGQVDGDETLGENYLTLTDKSSHYFVGETFNDIYKMRILLFNNGEVSDVSNRRSNIIFKMKDADGNDADPEKPFTKAGTYKVQAFIKNHEEIYSKSKYIKVLDGPTKQLTSKASIPENFNYYDVEKSCLSNLSIPSSGDMNVLVIPVEISDYPFSSIGYGNDYLSKIDDLFNGEGANDTLYWESISSYYQKSSFGKLNLQFDIADVYKPGKSSADLMQYGEYGAFLTCNDALVDYKAKHGSDSTKKYDNDHDGYVDAIWAVYSAPMYSTGAYGDNPGMKVFWAFCSDMSFEDPNIESPVMHSFGWASAGFMYECVEQPKVDAHTFIHETGHLLSLPDYYSYDFSGTGASGPQGGLAMMDLNIGDQDSFSKFALGWAKPYVPKDDCIVTIKPNTTSGDAILLADNWNGTAFDEYVLLDLVVPANLNELDSTEQYPGRPLYYNEPGIRMYHIDARLGGFKNTGGYLSPYKEARQEDYYLLDSQVTKIINNDLLKPAVNDGDIGYTVINANSGSRTLIDEDLYKNNRLITLVGADNKHCEIDNVAGSNNSLFRKGDSWTVNNKTTRFFSSESGDFNNGDSFSYVFTVLECTSESATIQIRKIK